MTVVSTSKVRDDFAEMLNRVAYRGERIVLDRRGKPVAALVPVEDVELLERLEEEMDLTDARKALREAKKKGTISHDKLKKELLQD